MITIMIIIIIVIISITIRNLIIIGVVVMFLCCLLITHFFQFILHVLHKTLYNTAGFIFRLLEYQPLDKIIKFIVQGNKA